MFGVVGVGLGALVVAERGWGKKSLQPPWGGPLGVGLCSETPRGAGTRQVKCLGWKIGGIHSQPCVPICALSLVFGNFSLTKWKPSLGLGQGG